MHRSLYICNNLTTRFLYILLYRTTIKCSSTSLSYQKKKKMMKWKLGFLIGVMFILSIALIDPSFGQRNLLISHSSKFPSLLSVYSMVILRLCMCVCVCDGISQIYLWMYMSRESRICGEYRCIVYLVKLIFDFDR